MEKREAAGLAVKLSRPTARPVNTRHTVVR